jgi:maleate isomerase
MRTGLSSRYSAGVCGQLLATQARMLGSAKVEVIGLAQSAASLAAEDFDEIIIQRMSEAAGVPAITAGQAIARSLLALGSRQ